MKIVVCLDKSGGMSLCRRRQSQDRVLREKLLSLVGDGRLLLNAYSARQFESTDKLTVSEDFWNQAGEHDFCFFENTAIPTDAADEWYLFFWNRDYPADCYFEVDLCKDGFQKIKTEHFVGSSHKKITLEVYGRA